MSKPRGIPSMTGIRGVAALWVMLFHAQQDAGRVFGLPLLEKIPVVRYGCLGVDLFFMLSGFVLMYAHASDFRTLRSDKLVRFARLRFTRVYPLNTVVLLLIAGFVAFQPGYVAWARTAESGFAFGGPAAFSAGAFARTLLLATRWFLPGSGEWNQPVWSLSLEILGYVIFPLLAFCAVRIERSWPFLAIASLSLIGSYAVLTRFAFECEISQIAVVRMLACFVTGIAVYRLWQLTPESGKKWAAWIAAASALGIVARDLPPFRSIVTHGNLQFNFLFASLLYALAFQRGAVNRWLASRPVVFLGKISFPLYLVHVAPLLWLRYFLLQNGARCSSLEKAALFASWVLGCIVAATLLHSFVEVPFHAWGRRWADGPRNVADALHRQTRASARSSHTPALQRDSS